VDLAELLDELALTDAPGAADDDELPPPAALVAAAAPPQFTFGGSDGAAMQE
jgi:hypothetical protein